MSLAAMQTFRIFHRPPTGNHTIDKGDLKDTQQGFTFNSPAVNFQQGPRNILLTRSTAKDLQFNGNPSDFTAMTLGITPIHRIIAMNEPRQSAGSDPNLRQPLASLALAFGIPFEALSAISAYPDLDDDCDYYDDCDDPITSDVTTASQAVKPKDSTDVDLYSDDGNSAALLLIIALPLLAFCIWAHTHSSQYYSEYGDCDGNDDYNDFDDYE